ncbi:hypothetical protein ACHAXA_001827 [Cyclostephanos tholiformis]|uniref:Uncharacterized protein n=1 Tax=Cyclostephanos tholiformis TaxID=382380 RepID=A0ABD3R9D3_9STRA
MMTTSLFRPNRLATASYFHVASSRIMFGVSLVPTVPPPLDFRRRVLSSWLGAVIGTPRDFCRDRFDRRRRRCFSSSSSPSTPSPSSSSSSSSSSPVRTFRYRTNDDADGHVRLSGLGPRRAAELEDYLLSRLRDLGDDDGRIVDPILGKPITRAGLDWIRSLSVPASAAVSLMGQDEDSIVVTIRPPTLMHPRLDELARGVADVVREGAASWVDSRRLRTSSSSSGSELYGIAMPGGSLEVRPDMIRVKVNVSPSGESIVPDSDAASSSSTSSFSPHRARTLCDVTHFLAVYSCKGGVGKSTVAVNLAYRLSALGGRVGLVDLDVYGPSLPLLVRPDDPTVRRSHSDMGPNVVEPITHRGVRLMSLGYVSPDSGVPGSGPAGGAAVMRGPMAGRVVRQLLNGTNWGRLDVLILDLPPGTGDVQLEACQSLTLSGAVAVSTPSALAWADVDKGVKMLGDMGVSTLAVVENMAYFVCEGGGRHYPFGKSRDWDDMGEADAASSSTSFSHHLPGPSRVFRLPISSAVHDANESGIPLCCDGGGPPHVEVSGDDEATDAFSRLADAISSDLLLLRHGEDAPSSSSSISRVGDFKAINGVPGATTSAVMIDEVGDSTYFDVPFTRLSLDQASGALVVRLFSDSGGYQKVISGIDLRQRDPRMGEKEKVSMVDAAHDETSMIRGGGGCGGGRGESSMVQRHVAHVGPKASAKDGLIPARVTRKGNYGYEVEWADGAKIIYSLMAIAKAAGGKSP